MMLFTLQLETKIVDAVDTVQCSAVQWSSSLWLPRKSCIVGRSPPSVMTSTSPRITSNDQKFSPVSRQLCSPNSLEWNAMKFYPALVYLTWMTPITHSDVFIQVPFNSKSKLRLDNAPYLIEAAFWKLGKCWGLRKSALLTHLRI